MTWLLAIIDEINDEFEFDDLVFAVLSANSE